jgi:hypothetical protein
VSPTSSSSVATPIASAARKPGSVFSAMALQVERRRGAGRQHQARGDDRPQHRASLAAL